MELRLDQEDRYFITTQLQAIDPETYYELVPGVVGRRLIPKIGQANPNLPTYKWLSTKLRGATKITRGRAKDQPMASVVREEKVHSIHTFEESFGWTIDEIRAAREVQGANLEKDAFTAALTKIEQSIDGALATGIPNTSATGIANNPDVAHTDGAISGGWLGSSSTPAGIVTDIRSVIQAEILALKQAQVPGNDMPMFTNFSLWLPNEHYATLGMTPFGLGTDVQVTTILEFLKKFPMLKAIEPWWRLDTADASNSNGPMGVLVASTDDGRMLPFIGGALLPMDLDRLPEQYTGRNVTIPIAGKCGGVPLRYPVAVRYLKKI